MRSVWLSWAVLLSSIAWASAQIQVELILNQEQFLVAESIPVKIRITNLSGQPVQLGQDPDWLTFQVQNLERPSEVRVAKIPTNEPYTLQSAKTVVRQLDLIPFFDFSRPGQYTIAASLRIKNWNQEFFSNAKSFDVSTGFRVWEQEFGVPTSNAPPEMRKYALLQANYVKRLMLYLRLTDASESRVYCVMPIAPLVSFSRPEAQMDQESNLHVLSQAGASSFIYMVITPFGQVPTRHRYDYTETRPVLRPKDGKIIVMGGIRRMTTEDVPPNSQPYSAPSTNLPAPISTNSTQAPSPSRK
jgi:hypothetical protein